VKPNPIDRPLLVVVGAGGVGKTTLAAALGASAAQAGQRTLVMTFDPSHRLKDALGVGKKAGDRPVAVPIGEKGGSLEVALLDARKTFDRLVTRYAPDRDAADRIFQNRFYRGLAGSLAGILEYMAVERLFEVAAEGGYDRVVLDTPPTRQALDFLQAPERIVRFLDSGAARLARSGWLAPRRGLAGLPARLATRGAGAVLDRVVGDRLLRDLLEFFQAFAPLFDGFRERALEVQQLLRAEGTAFLLVVGSGEARIPDAMYFARQLRQAGHHLTLALVNQVHPVFNVPAPPGSGDLARDIRLFVRLGERDRDGVKRLGALLAPEVPLLAVPLQPVPPTDLAALQGLGASLRGRAATLR
jgi:anion-transporting  ArsA/GET3 family ATPase